MLKAWSFLRWTSDPKPDTCVWDALMLSAVTKFQASGGEQDLTNDFPRCKFETPLGRPYPRSCCCPGVVTLATFRRRISAKAIELRISTEWSAFSQRSCSWLDLPFGPAAYCILLGRTLGGEKVIALHRLDVIISDGCNFIAGITPCGGARGVRVNKVAVFAASVVRSD